MVLNMLASIISAASFFSLGYAQIAPTLPAPGQPQRTGIPGGFEIIGESLVSAQQLFLGTEDKVIFVDKVEGNPSQINGHPAWASEWALGGDTQRPMEAVTNSFCAGGNVLGNGTWLNVGGNEAVTFGGAVAEDQSASGAPYFNIDGRTSMLTPCDDNNCEWTVSPLPTDQRWYPTLETLEDGSVIIIGGCKFGGYVNDPGQNNPTYQFFPPRGDNDIVELDLLNRTLPTNLYPLTWLLPSGKLLIQSNWATSLLDYRTNEETALDDIPDAVRVYPASAGSIMLPLTPDNNWVATVMFCGGSNVATDQWLSPEFIKNAQPAVTSCVKITPDNSKSYVQEDPLPEARVMVNLIYLPDGKILALNGAGTGTAGYGVEEFAQAVGGSYSDNPIYKPALYDPKASQGSKWSSEGLEPSTVARMYHSSAVLLPDGSVMVSGSNPNPDFVLPAPDVPYPTEYRTELWYPPWYQKRRPEPQGLLAQLSYGGPAFDVTLESEDLFGDVENVKSARVTIVRPGFSTHNIGPALIFVVVNGVPSVGKMIMVGSGEIGEQPIFEVGDLKPSEVSDAVSRLTDEEVGSAAHSTSVLLSSLYPSLIPFVNIETARKLSLAIGSGFRYFHSEFRAVPR
ncbi:copper radical oxidase [Coprinopsis sp. MPI-PUGE-AT-0042]|nr:copper radical oxidase [Coprinopsis sp. MPI-PUGE-AT-0042]